MIAVLPGCKKLGEMVIGFSVFGLGIVILKELIALMP